ncbi:M14 family metallopeptidase [Streptomyces radicis]|uniref:Zinc carboxypeptidase n=1 Tax=Streptomyces radicis TaxID=1750517 RepID=A0A3A9W6F2_9ACTN|nr:M14 family metallopeptidase [Streptomyces radicis]RKN04854.1 zinc carboxypeptidase [Streptomyces radicis]RKN25364.1 zinc carboxypeptidase [Streptomyces radicis]
MRRFPRGRRTAIAATVLTLALAVTTGAQATAAPDDRAPAAEAVRQYEVGDVATADARTALARTGTAIDEVRSSSVVITADEAHAERLADLGYELTALTTPTERGGPITAAAPGDYHTYGEALAAVAEAEAAYPDLVSSQVIGQSHEGRDIVAVKVSANVAVDEDEPEVLFTHNQHAREHLTVEMALYTLGELTSQYGTDPEITALLDSREVWLIPSVNPDGKVYDQESGSFRSWRKNRQPNAGSSSTGTDLNRNWAYEWGCCGGSSGSPGSETYRGAAPESGPETTVVADFVRGRAVGGEQQITAHIDFHTYGELVLWPYGFTYADTAAGLTADDAAAFEALGTAMADSNGYTPQQSSDLYITDGTINDWLWADQGIFSFTFEMYPTSSGGGGFYPPGDVIDRETGRNREAVLTLLSYADCAYRAAGLEGEYCAA